MLIKNRVYSACAILAVLLSPALAWAETLTVTYPTSHSISPRLSQLHGSPFVSGPTVIHPPLRPNIGHGQPTQDSAVQSYTGSALSVTTGTGFQGMSVYDGGYIPSDNNIAVGPNQIVEVVNAAVAVYDKVGMKLWGPIPMKNIWTNLTGSACAANNGGDVIVQYDRSADRWLLSQLGSLSKPYSECIAVSQTNNPAGAYYLYSYSFGNYLNDYPKFGVWPTATNSAYLATYNLFYQGRFFSGPEICAYDRAAMIAGDPSPAAVCATGLQDASYLPSDLDGTTPLEDGTPGYFVDLEGNNFGMYALKPDFASANGPTASLNRSTIGGIEGYTQASNSPQPDTSRTLDALSDRLMYRLAFRVFSDHEAMVVNHSVQTSSGNSGVRWYELRSPGVSNNETFSVYQQGTWAPDSSYRWMGSIAMDQAGNIALGYSVSNGSSIYPSVRFTGRSPGDTLGKMGTEDTIIAGSGSQTGYSRWGDYSSMRIDPSDDCTFWYVNEYLPQTSSYGWYTRIGSFKLNGCSGGSTVDYPPTVAITSPAGGATVSGTVNLTASASDTDSTGVAQVEFFVDGSSIGTDTDGSNGWSATWNTTGYSDGSHSVSATATDTAGQPTTSSSISVNVSNGSTTVPVHVASLTSSYSDNGSTWNATVTITVQDSSGNPVQSATVSGSWSGGTTGSTDCTTDSSGQCSVTSPSISDGTTSVSFTVTDIGGTGYSFDSTGTTSATVTCSSCSAVTTGVYISDMTDSSTSPNHGGKWNAGVDITALEDGTNAPASGDTVTGNWSGGASGSTSCSTDSNGICTVSKAAKGSSATFTVTDITNASGTTVWNWKIGLNSKTVTPGPH
jgi:hypothetical protein